MAPNGSHHHLRVQKVSKIFSTFDLNQDAHLDRDEMSALVVAVNPRVTFTDEQMEAILGEVFRNYSDYIDGDLGLSFDGLLQTYEDGAGDIDRDFNELGLALDEDRSAGPAMAEEVRSGTVKKRGMSSSEMGVQLNESWCRTIDVDDVKKLISELERKKGSCHGGGVVSASSGCKPSVGRSDHSWDDLGQDYLHFRREIAEIQKKIDQRYHHADAFEAHMAAGKLLFDHRFYKEAMASFQRGKELRPADVRPYFFLGNALYAMGEMQEAKEAYVSALNAAAEEEEEGKESTADYRFLSQVHVNLGIAMEAEGMLFAASEQYRQAARKEPKHYRALKLLGSALSGVGEYEAAREALLSAIALRADYTEAHCELGSVLLAMGEQEQAMASFHTALAHSPDHVDSLYNLGTLLKDAGHYREAASTYSRVLALQPHNWRAKLNRAVALLGAGDIDASKRAFKDAYRMTGRSELYEAIAHLRQISSSSWSDQSVGLCSFVVVAQSQFRRGSIHTAPPSSMACALDIRRFQRSTRLHQCDVSQVKKEISSSCAVMPDAEKQLISKEAMEKVFRRLLCFLKPEAFQVAMRMINEKVLCLLEEPARSGRLGLGLVLAILALVCGGSMERRKQVAFEALVAHHYCDRSRSGAGIPKRAARTYIQKLRRIYLQQSTEEEEEAGQEEEDSVAMVTFPEFVRMLDNSECGLGFLLGILQKLETKKKLKETWPHSTCSVCCYRINGPIFKETTLRFTLCSECYSSSRVPTAITTKSLNSKHFYYYFKQYDSEIEALLDKVHIFRSPFGSCSELRI